jgi:predicted GNAT family N-acyltransferase
MIVPLSHSQHQAELEQIYKLRLLCWEEYWPEVRTKHSGGWFDDLDKTGQHFAIYSGTEIVAAARVSILEQVKDVPVSRYFDTEMYEGCKVGLISRNVVHPHYRGCGYSKMLDQKRLTYLDEQNTPYCFCWGARIRQLESYGFKKIVKLPMDASENVDRNDNYWIMVRRGIVEE